MAKKIIVTAIIAIFGIVVNFTACDNGTDPGDNDPRPASPEPMSPKTAMQYFTDEGITAGWNLGNTLDAVNNWSYENPVAEEECWGNPKANQAIFNGVKERGFKIVRMPCTWTGHIGPAPDYKVSQDRLRRVAEVACYARDAGLKAIINLHHDDGEDWGGWLLLGNAAANQNDRDQITDKFEKVWTQIAEYFKDYGDWLIFESMNEVHDEDWGWSQSFQSNPALFIGIVNKWNQSFTDAVRSTGSNNAQRFLMYPSYASNPECIISDGKVGDAEPGQYFELPTDSAGNDRRIVTFHYYDPSEFGGDNGVDIDWEGTQEQKDSINALFGKFKTEFIDKNIPVVIGEIGRSRAYGSLTPQELTTSKEARLSWVDYTFTTAKENKLVPVWWDNGNYKDERDRDQFGLFDRKTGKPNSDENGAIINAITK